MLYYIHDMEKELIDLVSVNKVVANITDSELSEAFRELEEWKYKTGQLKNGVVKEILVRWETLSGNEEDLRVLEQAILYEIGRRYVKN